MEKYIHDENLKLYRKVLSVTTEDQKRKQLIDLIRDEVAKETAQKARIGLSLMGSPPNAFVLAAPIIPASTAPFSPTRGQF
mgnify:CR=1 FL=1